MDNASPFPLEPPLPPPRSPVERRERRLRRIRDIRFAELAYRGWQEASKWLERVAPMELPERPDALLRKHAPALADPARRFGSCARSRHSASLRRRRGAAAALLARLPDYRTEIFEAADALLKRHFDLLSYRTLWFGDPIDWHLDPVGADARRWCRGAVIDRSMPSGRRQPSGVGIEPAPVAGPPGTGVQVTGDERYAARASAPSTRGSTRTRRASASTGRATSKSRCG